MNKLTREVLDERIHMAIYATSNADIAIKKLLRDYTASIVPDRKEYPFGDEILDQDIDMSYAITEVDCYNQAIDTITQNASELLGDKK